MRTTYSTGKRVRARKRCEYEIQNYIDEHGDSHLIATHDISVDLVENLYGEKNPAAFHTHLCRLTQAWCYKLIGKCVE